MWNFGSARFAFSCGSFPTSGNDWQASPPARRRRNRRRLVPSIAAVTAARKSDRRREGSASGARGNRRTTCGCSRFRPACARGRAVPIRRTPVPLPATSFAAKRGRDRMCESSSMRGPRRNRSKRENLTIARFCGLRQRTLMRGTFSVPIALSGWGGIDIRVREGRAARLEACREPTGAPSKADGCSSRRQSGEPARERCLAIVPSRT